jgi:hypothetical protein
VHGEGGPDVTRGEKVEMSADVEYSWGVYLTVGMGQSAGSRTTAAAAAAAAATTEGSG